MRNNLDALLAATDHYLWPLASFLRCNTGRIITKQELFIAIWGNEFEKVIHKDNRLRWQLDRLEEFLNYNDSSRRYKIVKLNNIGFAFIDNKQDSSPDLISNDNFFKLYLEQIAHKYQFKEFEYLIFRVLFLNRPDGVSEEQLLEVLDYKGFEASNLSPYITHINNKLKSKVIGDFQIVRSKLVKGYRLIDADIKKEFARLGLEVREG